MAAVNLEADVRRVIDSLSRDDTGRRLPPDVIEETVRASFAGFSDARIPDYVGLFAERVARQQLRQLAVESAAQGNAT